MYLIGADSLLLCDESFTTLKKGGIYFNEKEILEIDLYENLQNKPVKYQKYYHNCVITPTLSNLHLHLEFSQNKGVLEFGNFGKWLDSVIENRDSLMDDSLQTQMQQEIQNLLKSGVGFVGAISSYGYDLEILANSPLRTFYFNEVMGSKPEILDALYQNLLARLEESKKFASQKFFPALAIHSPYSVHPALLKQALNLAKTQNLPLSVHFLESKEEREWLESKTGYFQNFFKKFFNAQMQPFYTPSEFLESLKTLKPYFVHCLEATHQELEAIAKMQGHIISCVKSNRLLNNKVLDLNLCKKLGIHPIFATDGKSSNDSLSLLDELRTALYVYANEDLESLAKTLLLGVTYYAHKNNPLGIKTGSLQKGFLPDFAIFKLNTKHQSALDLLLYAKEAKALYISGKQII